MQINISVRHGQLATETQEKITEKLRKLTRYSDRISAVQATVDLNQPATPDVELIVLVDGAGEFVAKTKANGGKLLGAVESTMQKVEEQMKRYKEKKIDQHRSQAAKHMNLPGDDEATS